MAWRFKKQFEHLTIVMQDRVTVDKFTITDEKVNNLLNTSSDFKEYFERENDPGLQVKPKRLKDEG